MDTAIDIPSVTNLLPTPPQTVGKTVAAFSAFRLAIPVIQTLGTRTFTGRGLGSVIGLGVTSSVALTIAIKPQESFQVVQDVFQTTTDYINLFFNIVADVIRSETKNAVDSERITSIITYPPPSPGGRSMPQQSPNPYQPKLYTLEPFPFTQVVHHLN